MASPLFWLTVYISSCQFLLSVTVSNPVSSCGSDKFRAAESCWYLSGWADDCVWSTARVCSAAIIVVVVIVFFCRTRYSASQLHSSGSASLLRRHSTVHYFRHRTPTNHKPAGPDCPAVSGCVWLALCTAQRFSIISGDCAAGLRHDINVPYCLKSQRGPATVSMFAQCDDVRRASLETVSTNHIPAVMCSLFSSSSATTASYTVWNSRRFVILGLSDKHHD